MKDRHILDCVIATLECFNVLDTKVYQRNMAIKFNTRKAFDTLEWSFLLNTLSAIGFSTKFVEWPFYLIGSLPRSIVLLCCGRGVRQGDPLSPLLFCITEDVWSMGIIKFMQQDNLYTISSIRGVCAPFYIFYADDLIVFAKLT